MGFLDKAKATAAQAMQQGQAKVEQIQQSRQESELYKTLGEAVYKAQRQGGDQSAVDAALTALDSHFASVQQAAESAAAASAAAAGSAAGSAAPPTAPPTTPPTTPPSAAPQEGNFTRDDM